MNVPAVTPIRTYDDAVSFLDRHIGLGIRPGLDRMRRLLELMAEPHRAYPVIHVAGTNGKTTTARIVSSLLMAHGLSVGTFTSPHLQRVEERLAFDLEPASPEEFASAIGDVAPFVDLLETERAERATYFELTAAAAFAWFAERAVDVAVVEVGLGGRLDATNVVEAPVAVVTSIGLDHQAFLGDTLAAIAREKLAIAHPGSTLVTGALPPEAAAEAQIHAERLGLAHRRLGEEFRVESSSLAVGGWLVDVAGVHETYPDLHLPLHGRFQVDNLAVAVAAVESFFERPLDEEVVREGTAAVTSPGRMEVIGHHPLVVLDGAHNPQGMAALARTLAEEFPEMPWTLVVGAMGDKDLSEMLAPMRPHAGHVIATAVDSPRAREPEEVARVAADVLGVSTEVVVDPAGALARAREVTAAEHGIVVAGSLYLVGDVRNASGL